MGRDQVLHFRFRRQELHREPATTSPEAVALLDHGVQDTGTDGAAWALALRGASPPWSDDLALAWTLRGAPHAYRRSDLAAVAVATAPLTEADAAKRVFDAAKPLRAAGMPVLDGLRTVAGRLREIVTEPTVKGDVSARLTAVLDPPFLRQCRPCGTTHIYEQPFRLASLQAGLELEAGTSPPVLWRVPGMEPALFGRQAGEADHRLDVIRTYLRFFGPARVQDVATHLDAPVRDVKAHWPEDVVEVTVAGEADGSGCARFVLASDADDLVTAGELQAPVVRLVGPFDPYLQIRDRELLVPNPSRRKELWPALGRPGAIVAGGSLLGTWRPRAAGPRLTVRIQAWQPWSGSIKSLVDEQAARLSEHRQVTLAAVVEP